MIETLQIACLIGIVPLVFLDRAATRTGPEGDELGTNFAIAAILVLSDALVIAGLLFLFSALQPHVVLLPPPPFPVQLLLALVLGDFLSYWHHRLLHRVRWLWASHIVHHQSRDIDLSTGLRNHPFGPVSEGLFWSPLLLTGIEPQVMLIAAAMIASWVIFIHSRRSRQILGPSRWLGYILNLPAHHLMHHREATAEAHCNFALLFILWDRWFGTFCPPARADRFGTAGEPAVAPVRRLLWEEWRNQLGFRPSLGESRRAATREEGLMAYFAAVALVGMAAAFGGS